MKLQTFEVEMRKIHVILLVTVCFLLFSCGGAPPEPPVSLTIVSGSENKELEPMVRAFGEKEGINITMAYKGSVDIMLALDKTIDYDAVWPANGLWLRLGDRQRQVRHEKSIMRSPVVFAVKKSVAERLGWVGKDVQVADIQTAAESGQLRFAMTSATQSNSGASAYLGFLHALAESPDVLTAEHLKDPEVQDRVRRLLRTVNRSSGSSGWLKDLVVENYFRYDAMVNYEALVIEANKVLVARGEEPLFCIYPADGMMVADSPLGYVDKGDPAKEKAFLKLQEYLLSPEARANIAQLGRRSGVVGLEVENPNPAVFNPQWGIDTNRLISPVPLPREAVIREALSLYQTSLRKPSLTIYALDYSGSMKGEGNSRLKEAMETLLEPEVAKRYMLQSSPKDIHVVIPFNSEVITQWETVGNEPAQLRDLLSKVNYQQVGGGTDIYAATSAGFDYLELHKEKLSEYFPAVILMTDGRSKGSLADLTNKVSAFDFAQDVPIFSITFGEADPSQLEEIERRFEGRVFDGKKDLVNTFRKAKGYN